ncbi:MAG: glycosyltransferase family 39 protein [Chloroflexi bacterium]|nr:glycosyltransferase family 39 protein [Chloroflexota bacterium]
MTTEERRAPEMTLSKSYPALNPPREPQSSTPLLPVAVVSLFALGLLLRLAAVFYFGDFTNPVTAEYGITARNLAEGRGFIGGAWFGPEAPTALNAPAYVVLLAASMKYFGAQAYLALEIAQALLSALLPLLIHRLARLLFDRRVAFISFLVAVAYPPFIYFPKQISPAVLTTLAAVLAVLSILELARRRGLVSSLLIGLVLGLVALIEPIGVIMAIGVGALLRRSLSFRSVALAATVALLVVLPWEIRNYVEFGAVVPIKTSFGLNLWFGNNPYATGYLFTADGRPMAAVLDPGLAEELSNMDEVQRYAALARQALGWIVGNPMEFAELSLRRVFYFWWTSPTVDVASFQAYEPPYLYKLQVILLAPFLVLGAAGACWAYRRNRQSFSVLIWWLASFTLVYAVSVAANSRFRLPAEPALIVLSAYAAVAISTYIARRLHL